jgi:hypothetical protein
MHRVKHVLYRYFPENWGLYTGTILYVVLSYIQVSIIFVPKITNMVKVQNSEVMFENVQTVIFHTSSNFT